MTTPTEIANIAITELGGDPINDITENSKAAKVCLSRYNDIRDAVLRLHPWKCAKRGFSLPSAGKRDFEYANSFALPSDPFCLRVLGLSNRHIKYKLMGRFILTDANAPLRGRYIARVGEDEWDALLTQAVGMRLGAAIAYRLTTSHEQVKRLQGMFKDALGDARSVNAQEDVEDEYFESEILGDRDS